MAAGPLVCPGCGARAASDARLCEDCGTPLVQEPGTADDPPGPDLGDIVLDANDHVQ